MRRLILVWNLLTPVVMIFLLVQGRWGAGAAILLSAHAPWLWATLCPRCSWWGPQMLKQATHEREVWLTIDDGPHAEDTPALLEVLDEFGAKATFFVIGTRAKAHPELIREIIRRGHEIGNHTLTHPAVWFWACLPGRIEREVAECSRIIREIVPEVKIHWFRAPAGLRNHWLHPVLKKHGLSLANWSARGFDAVSRDHDTILRRITRHLRPGAVILMHEGQKDSGGPRLAARLLRSVLQRMRTDGLTARLPQPTPFD
jgi:peptidoglycan/xylan/chitin deacetylase (PgdA/CDA1 family)